MECKADYISSGVPAVYIGIYPEWNVKAALGLLQSPRCHQLEYIQNGM